MEEDCRFLLWWHLLLGRFDAVCMEEHRRDIFRLARLRRSVIVDA